jgi:peptidyl-prolyl cis-trans isomerase SurA
MCVCAGISLLPAVVRAEVIDRIVALVGHQIILQSDLDAQVALQSAQQRIDLEDSVRREAFTRELLDQMVQDRLMLIQAERGSALKVSDQDVDAELDEHIKRIQSQFASQEDFFKQLADEGLTVTELRRRYRSEVKNQLLKQKLIDQKLRSVAVSPPEVDEFYATYKDSLPTQPAAVHLADIVLAIDVGASTIDSVRARAQAVSDSIFAGANFEEMARRYSSDASAQSGGDLGWFGRGVMVPAFERAAFGLSVGEVSGLVQTKFGFHLIKSLERSENRVHAAHVLFRTTPTEADLAVSRERADSIWQALQSGADFSALVKQYSADSVSAAQGGDLGWVPTQSLQEPFVSTIGSEPGGTILGPVASADGIHIIKIVERREEKPYDPVTDRSALTEMARREKTGRVVEDWVRKLRDHIYVEVRL